MENIAKMDFNFMWKFEVENSQKINIDISMYIIDSKTQNELIFGKSSVKTTDLDMAKSNSFWLNLLNVINLNL